MMEFKPWELYPHIWKTEASYMSFLRGGIRRGLWEKNPIKLEFLKERTVKMENTNPRSMKRYPTVNAGMCDMCNEMYKMAEMEVDHKVGQHSLRSVADVERFIHGIVYVRKEDLALLCKPCHNIKTYSEKCGVSIEEATMLKEAIAVMNMKAADQKAWLTARGIIPASNEEKRREQVINSVKGG